MEAIERNVFSMDWATIVLLLSLSILVVARNIYTLRFGDFVMLFATNKYMTLKGKEHNIYHPFNILLFVVNIISVSLFLFICSIHFFEIEKPPLPLFLQIATGYTFLVLVKFSVEKIVSNIFSMDEIVDYYLFHKLSYRNFIALMLLPLNVVLLFSLPPTSMILYITIGLMLLINFLVLISFYFKIQKEIFSRWFYFIVYLCALEIGPYFILYKLIMK